MFAATVAYGPILSKPSLVRSSLLLAVGSLVAERVKGISTELF